MNKKKVASFLPVDCVTPTPTVFWGGFWVVGFSGWGGKRGRRGGFLGGNFFFWPGGGWLCWLGGGGGGGGFGGGGVFGGGFVVGGLGGFVTEASPARNEDSPSSLSFCGS